MKIGVRVVDCYGRHGVLVAMKGGEYCYGVALAGVPTLRWFKPGEIERERRPPRGVE